MAHMLENRGPVDAAVSAIQIRGARFPDQVLVFSGVEAPSKQ